MVETSIYAKILSKFTNNKATEEFLMDVRQYIIEAGVKSVIQKAVSNIASRFLKSKVSKSLFGKSKEKEAPNIDKHKKYIPKGWRAMSFLLGSKEQEVFAYSPNLDNAIAYQMSVLQDQNMKSFLETTIMINLTAPTKSLFVVPKDSYLLDIFDWLEDHGIKVRYKTI